MYMRSYTLTELNPGQDYNANWAWKLAAHPAVQQQISLGTSQCTWMLNEGEHCTVTSPTQVPSMQTGAIITLWYAFVLNALRRVPAVAFLSCSRCDFSLSLSCTPGNKLDLRYDEGLALSVGAKSSGSSLWNSSVVLSSISVAGP
jgi:hypothetical protein